MDGSRTITRVATVLAAVFAGTSVGLYLSLKSARAQRLEPRAGASIHSVEEVPATSPLRTASAAEASLRDAPLPSAPASPKPGAEDAPRDTSIIGALPALRDAPDRPDAVRAAMATLIEDMASYAGLDQHESDRLFNYKRSQPAISAGKLQCMSAGRRDSCCKDAIGAI